jgi:hypothetical protein
MLLPEAKPILLGSLTTLSHSVFREKKPVPLLGKINVGGYTRGMRSIAGTMVFTLINQHLTEDIIAQVPYLKEHDKVKADEIPFFDLMVVCANEYGSASQMMIYGAEFYEDGQVISVQDIYIENTFSFVARDIDDFRYINPIVNYNKATGDWMNIDTVVPYDYYLDEYNNSYNQTLSNDNQQLIDMQTALIAKGYNNNTSGILDNETQNNLKLFQESVGLYPTGIVDDTTYAMVMNTGTTKPVITVSNSNGALVYSDETKSTILGIAKYQSQYTGEVGSEFVKIDFYGQNGYIELENTDQAPTKTYAFDSYTEPSTIQSTTWDAFDASTIGAHFNPTEDTEVQIAAISYYDNNAVLTNTRYYTVGAGESKDLSLSYIPDAYIYNLNYKQLPNKIDFIVTPQGEQPKKWTVKFVG